MTPMQIDQFLASPCHVLSEPCTWRAWFQHVLNELIEHPGTFSGKRPGCNSDWSEQLAESLGAVCPDIAQRGEGQNCDYLHVDEDKYQAACKAVIDRLINGVRCP